jgi:hypothetical protein
VGAAGSFDIEVIHALPDGAVVKSYRLVAPATVADALALAAADPVFHGIDVKGAATGIFGRVVPHTRALQRGDRIEIYRALAADPKEARRRRVQRAQAQKPNSPRPGAPRR